MSEQVQATAVVDAPVGTSSRGHPGGPAPQPQAIADLAADCGGGHGAG